MRFRFLVCWFLFISSKWMTQSQFMFCSSDDDCRAFLAPSCDWAGFCDIPTLDTHCDYLGAGSGKKITIDGNEICTRTCSSHSDCSHLPTAKVCQTESSFPNYNTCVECKNTADCTAIGFKNHICPDGFCKYPNPSGTGCLSSNYCFSLPGAECYDDAIRCWARCEIDTDCGASGSGAKCLLGVLPITGGVCSFPANIPPSAGSPSGCTSHADCTTAAAAKCDGGNCVACDDDSQCTRFSATQYCDAGTCQICRTSDHAGCTTESLARCDPATYSCTVCNDDLQCSTRFPSTPYCEGGVCRACKISDHTGCTDITAAKCISSPFYQCTTCDDDAQCSRFTPTPYCEGGTCRVCKTSDNTGCGGSTPFCVSGACRACKPTDNIVCTSTTASKCDPSSYTCTSCSDDSDCEHLDPNKHCESGICRPCKPTGNIGCDLIAEPRCDSTSYTCTTCSIDDDCARFSPTVYCVANTCVACKTTGNIGCNLVTAPRCDSSTYTCTTCLDDTDCNLLFSPYSYCEGGSCVICKTSDNSGCTMPSPKCVSTPSYACTACTVDMDCSGPTPYCESNSCATCKTSDNSGCGGSTPFCVSGTCRTCKPGDNTGCTLITASKCEPSSYTCTQCSADADCTHLSSTPYCEGNTCRSCKTSDNSGCTSITASKCDPSSYSCTSCSADEDCDNISSTPYCEGSICVTCKVSDNSGCSDPNTICSQGSGGNSCESNSGTTSCPSNMPPIGGTFNVAPGTGGLPLSTSYSASLTGWVSQNGGTLSYALEYIKATPLSSDPVQISDFSVDTQYDFYLPYTSIATIRATILDESSCSKNVSIDVTLNLSPPNGTDLLQTAKSFLNLISLAEAPTSAMNVLVDQINIANQLLLCANDLDSSKCNATQMMSCGTSGTCSNHGICTQLGCVCNEGYYLRDCSLERFEYELQTQLRQGLINSTVTSLNEQNIPEMMSILNALTQKPYLNTNSTLNLTLNAVTQAIQVLNSSSYDNANLAADIQDIADVISNAFDQITTLDCSLYNNFSLRALNQSYDLLQQLSDVFVKSASDSSETQLSITTNAFLMFFGIYDSSELNNLQINMNENAPQIQISSIQNQASLPPSVALTYIYLKKDPLKCGDTSPATNFTLEFKNAETLKEIHLNASILVTYPQSTFGQVPCPARCFRGNDPEGNRTCFCTDISIFDVKNQLGRLYRESNLHLLTLSNIAKMFTSAIYLQWSFWVVVVSLVWLIVTLIVVKTGNKDYCLAKKVRRKKHKNASRSRLGKNFMYFAVIHPLLGIYFYGGRYATSKAFRALIYFVRVMSLLGTSAVFMKNPDANENSEVTFEGEIFSLDIYLMLAPMVVVLPVMFIIQKTLAKPKPKKTRRAGEKNKQTLQSENTLVAVAAQEPKKRSKFVTVFGIILAILLAVGGIIAALTISIQINSSQQLSWAAKFTKSIAQDMFVSPLVTLALNGIALQFTRCGRCVKNMAKTLTDETILELSSGLGDRTFGMKKNVITTLRQANLFQPNEGQLESKLSPANMSQVKKESLHSRKKVAVPDLNYSNTIDKKIKPNFICNLDESHQNLNVSSFHETSNRREINTQRNLLSRRIDLEVSSSRQGEGIMLRRPKRLKQNFHNNSDNSQQYSDQGRLKATTKAKNPRK